MSDQRSQSNVSIVYNQNSKSNDQEIDRYQLVERGQLYTLSYRCYFRDTHSNSIVSPFHDIDLINDRYTTTFDEQSKNIIYNMVVEVPRWSNAKMEINKQLKMNPLVQDVKSGKPRFVNNIFPYHGYLWNYGALPQTWEDPKHRNEDTHTFGDNDPLDVCEIGSTLHSRGSIVPIKVVGVLGLIDEGETDWKLIGIDVRDKMASEVNDINDVEGKFPGLLDHTRRWFKYYKVPSGKGSNHFAHDGRFRDRSFATRIIKETHDFWLKLTSGAVDINRQILSITNTTLKNSNTIDKDEAECIVENSDDYLKPGTNIDPNVDLLFYIKDSI